MGDGDINYFGLLYIDRARNLDANVKWTLKDPIDIYISCAGLLAKSALACGMPFGLLTNDAAYVERRLSQLGFAQTPVHPIPFSMNVPRVKNFYSAHFKIDAIKHLATGKLGKLIGLIDLDTVFNRPMPPEVKAVASSSFAAYDVSNDVFPLHYHSRIPHDLELIADCKLDAARWYGGEFLAATSDNMGVLHSEVSECWPRYVQHIKKLHHIGDEMPISAALNRLSGRGVAVADMGRSGAVVRWWSRRTKYPQPTFEALDDRSLLHLPFDKKFLAEQARYRFTRQAFLDAYKAYLRRKMPVRKLIGLVESGYLARIDDR